MTMCEIEQNRQLLDRGLRQVKEKNNTDWEPENIIEMCHSGRAFIFNVDEGFYILRPFVNPYTNERHVECVAAYSDLPFTGESLIQKYFPLIEINARAIGAVRIVWDSPRRGYERIPGVEISTIVFQKEVCYG